MLGILRVVCVFVILDSYHGHLIRENGYKQTIHRRSRVYGSQNDGNQNYKLLTKEDITKLHASIPPVFGTRLKPRTINYFDYHKEDDINTYTLFKKHDSHILENVSFEDFIATSGKVNVIETRNKLLNDVKITSVLDDSKARNNENLIEIENKNPLELHDLQSSESENGNRLIRDHFEDYQQSHRNVNEPKYIPKDEHILPDIKSNGKPKSLLSFRSDNRNARYGWKTQSPLKSHLRQLLYPQNSGNQVFESNCNATSDILYVRKPGSNTKGQFPFKAPDYLPPTDKTVSNKTKENFPSQKPCCNGKSPTTFNTTKRPYEVNTTKSPYTKTTITKRPLTTNSPATSVTTKKPDYIPFYNQKPNATKLSCNACSSTNGPSYISGKPPPRTAQAGDNKGTGSTIERGDVPDEDFITPDPNAYPESDDSTPTTTSATTTITSTSTAKTTTRRKGFVAPASAMPVPPEPDETTSSATTTSPTSTILLNTTPSTSNTTILTTETPEYNRHQTDTESPSLSMGTKESTPKLFQGDKYLPPEYPTKMPVRNTTSYNPAPAMAMPVPPEPPETPSVPPSTTTTPESKTTAKTTEPTVSTDYNRHLLDEPTTASMATESITTIPFKGPGYLPPKDFIPGEGFEGTESSVKSPVVTSNTTIPDTNLFKAPEYLPPRVPALPKPATAMPVTSESESISNNTPDIDERSAIKDGAPAKLSRAQFEGPHSEKFRVGRSSKTLRLGELSGTPRPVWFAGIYKKTTKPYYPICGGSIIREDVVISAAHCFWDDNAGLQPASLFAVATRKIYKPYDDPMDKKAQKSDVMDIKIPPRFLGAKTNFQEDLAVLRLVTAFIFTQSMHGVRPICVDFDVDFDRQQLSSGHYGTVAGWGLTDAEGSITQRLLWLELPYVEIEQCILDSDDDFLKYITCDKICAGENDSGKALCRGDSGGGLALWQGEPGHATPYLRGVASTAPRSTSACNVLAYASFTHLHAHRTFLREHVPDVENCRFWP